MFVERDNVFRVVSVVITLGFACLLLTSAQANDESHVLFTNIGKAAASSAYGHLIVTINFSAIFHQHVIVRNEFQKLKELQFNTLEKGQRQASDSIFRTYGLERLEFALDVGSVLINEIGFFLGFEDSIVLDQNVTREFGTSSRFRRQALLGTLLSFGAIVYEEVQIQDILSEDRRRDQHISALELVVDDHAKQLSRHASLIRDLRVELHETTATLVEYGRIQAIVQTVAAFILTHNAELQNFAEGVFLSAGGRLCPLLTNPEAAIAAFKDLERIAAGNSLVPIFDSPARIFDARLSSFWDGEIIKFIVHVPFRSAAAMDLFKFIRLPVPLTNESVCRVHTDELFIAVDDTHSSHFTMTFEESEECTRAGNVHICPAAQLINQDMKDSCLGSIFIGDVTRAQELCDLTVSKFDQIEAVRVTDCVVRFAIPEPGVMAIEKCNNSALRSFHVQGFQTFQLAAACRLTVGQWSFVCPFKFKIEANKILRLPTTFLSLKLQALTDAGAPISEFDDAVAEQPSDEPLTYEQALAKLSREPFPHIWVWVVVSAAALAACVCGFGLLAWHRRRARVIIQEGVPPRTFPVADQQHQPVLPEQRPETDTSRLPSMVTALQECRT